MFQNLCQNATGDLLDVYFLRSYYVQEAFHDGRRIVEILPAEKAIDSQIDGYPFRLGSDRESLLFLLILHWASKILAGAMHLRWGKPSPPACVSSI
ncbi:hypothetical protein VMCG_01109 [Cytospora schulzeri]|uniref:Uncharacterized protein n=1 Tax=Cytospora schulzeri TaxID=448051 RepID=A0A423X6N4_9PEZI|nr:hypothetical protein VMCG_01109 [Valsa malicola]